MCVCVQINKNLPALPLSSLYLLTTSHTPQLQVFLITRLHLYGIISSSLVLWWATQFLWLSHHLGKFSIGGYHGHCNELLKKILNSLKLVVNCIKLFFSRACPVSQHLWCFVPQKLWLKIQNYLGQLIIFMSTKVHISWAGLCWFIFDLGYVAETGGAAEESKHATKSCAKPLLRLKFSFSITF